MEQHLRHLLDELSAAIGRTRDRGDREELTRLQGAVEQHLEATGTDDGGGDARDDGDDGGLVDIFEKAASFGPHRSTGLGMWIVAQLVESLQGTVGLEPRPGGGLTVRARFPVGPTMSVLRP